MTANTTTTRPVLARLLLIALAALVVGLAGSVVYSESASAANCLNCPEVIEDGGGGPEPDPAPAPAPGPAPAPAAAALSESDDEFTSYPTFKGCHGMYTEATLFRSLNKVTAHTDIWSDCWFGGFTGKAVVILADGQGRTINAMQRSYGVNGQFEASIGFGPNKRYDLVWDQPFPAEEVALAKGIYVSHSHDPHNRLADILAEAVRIMKPAVELVTQVKTL